MYALVWDFCPGLKYFVLTDTFTRPALREGPYHDLEQAVLLPQTQSPAHHSSSHQHARMEQRRRKRCGPGGHTCSPREVFPRMATGSLWFASHRVDPSAPGGILCFLTPLVLGWDVSKEVYPQDYLFQGPRELGVPVYSELRQQLIGHVRPRIPAVPGGETLPSRRS